MSDGGERERECWVSGGGERERECWGQWWRREGESVGVSGGEREIECLGEWWRRKGGRASVAGLDVSSMWLVTYYVQALVLAACGGCGKCPGQETIVPYP